jgi:AmmeMemoRadiSam system protein B
MIRKPAVAGRFYSSEPNELLQTVESFIEPADKVKHAIGIVAPHAGYMYSGHVAGAVYSRVQLPPRNIVLCPNHTGRGKALSIMNIGTWRTPLGDVAVNDKLAAALMTSDPHLEHDIEAHRFEHAIEVQLPFMQKAATSSPSLCRSRSALQTFKGCWSWARRWRRSFAEKRRKR